MGTTQWSIVSPLGTSHQVKRKRRYLLHKAIDRSLELGNLIPTIWLPNTIGSVWLLPLWHPKLLFLPKPDCAYIHPTR